MKIRNKKTGEIVDLIEIVRLNDISNKFYLRLSDNEGRTFKVGFNSLAKLNSEWEDYEELPEWYWVNYDGSISHAEEGTMSFVKQKQIGNYFKTKEEAEKAVEKFKAWKRLKNKGFKVDLWDYNGGNYQERIRTGRILFRVKDYEENDADLDLLFGGEE